ncbi:MAG: GNAT family N-acetyltransferase [Ramlibacter sp.]
MDTAHKADASTLMIRSAEPQDAAAISALLGTPGSFEGTLQLPDVPVASRIEMLQKVDPQGCRLVALDGAEVIAHAGLHLSHPGLRRSHVRVLGIVIAPAWQGRGIGRELINRLLHWSDNWAGVLRVELAVHADNERAIALYLSLGFVEEGRHLAYALKDGRYVDSFSMARLHPSPPQLAG